MCTFIFVGLIIITTKLSMFSSNQSYSEKFLRKHVSEDQICLKNRCWFVGITFSIENHAERSEEMLELTLDSKC